MLTQMMNVGYDTYKTKTERPRGAEGQGRADSRAGEWIYAAYYDNVLAGRLLYDGRARWRLDRRIRFSSTTSACTRRRATRWHLSSPA